MKPSREMAKLDSALGAVDDETFDPEVEFVNAATIKPAPVEWLWNGWLAKGMLHILAGPPGAGKTTVAVALAATLSSGDRWPDGKRAETGHVVIWSGEDSVTHTLVPRLIACGAGMENINFAHGVVDVDGRRPFDLSTDMDALRRKLLGLPEPPALIIVDPIVLAVSGDSHKNTEVRRALQPLVDLGRDLGIAVLGITHYTKGTKGRDPVERVTGSIAFSAIARLVLGAAKLNEDHEHAPGRILVRAKSNIGLDEGGFVYDLDTIVLDDGIETTQVLWRTALEGNARELLAAAETVTDPEERTERDNAAEFLVELLSGGSKSRKDVVKAAKPEGLSMRTVERAANALGVQRNRSGYQAGSRWSLPIAPSSPEQDSGGVNGDGGVNGMVTASQRTRSRQHSIRATAPSSGTGGVVDDRIRDMADEAAAVASRSGAVITGSDVLATLSADDLDDPELMNPDWLRAHAASVQSRISTDG